MLETVKSPMPTDSKIPDQSFISLKYNGGVLIQTIIYVGILCQVTQYFVDGNWYNQVLFGQ